MNGRNAQDSDSLKRQLQERRESLRLIDERMAEFVLQTDVPLQLKKEKQRLEQEIARLETQLARAKLPITEPADRKDNAHAENETSERKIPLFVLFLTGFILTVIAVISFNQPFRCLLEYRVSEATVALIVLLVGIAAAALVQIFPPAERMVLQSLIGGVCLALLVSVLVFLPLGPPAEVVCFATKTPILAPVLPTATLSKTPMPTDTPISTSAPTVTLGKTPISTDILIPTSTSSPTLLPGATRVWEEDSSVMVYVPAGKFWMGSTDQTINALLSGCVGCRREDYIDEQPYHEVYLDAFWIDRSEVTNRQYRLCVDDGACSPSAEFRSRTRDSYYDSLDFDNYPVIYVSWRQADAYCHWIDKRLPTEAEWEKAARDNDGRTYPWGENIDCDHANYGTCVRDTTEVESYLTGASLYGVLNIVGNVQEWVVDWYGSNYYANSPSSNPQGPDLGERRVIRGGAWFNHPGLLRIADRSHLDPASHNDLTGFRCALSDVEP